MLKKVIVVGVFTIAIAVTIAAASPGDGLKANLRKEIALTGFLPQSLAFASDGSLAVAGLEGGVQGNQVMMSSSGMVMLLDAPKYARKTKIAEGAWPGDLRFLPDGRLVGSVSSSLRVWNAKGAQLNAWADVENVAYSADGTIAAIELKDGSYGVVDLGTASQTGTFPKQDVTGELVVAGAKPSLLHAKSGRLFARDLASGSDADLGEWTHGDLVVVAVSPQANVVAIGSASGAVVVIDTAEKKTLAANALESSRINTVAFSPDGSAVAFGGVSGALHLWSVTGQRSSISFGKHKTPILGVAFSSDGRAIATSSFEGTVKVWDVSTSGEGAADAPVEKETIAVVEPPFSQAGPVLATGTIRFGKPAKGTVGREEIDLYLVEVIGGKFKGFARFDKLPPGAAKKATALGYGPGNEVDLYVDKDGRVTFIAPPQQ